jgi:molecular chaperone HscB
MVADPFDTLGIEPRFDLDPDALAERHRALAAALHPDRYGGRPAGERRLALERAVEVNAAWRALSDPVRRAAALLERAGIAMGERSEPPPAPELLMEMMEAREALAEARRAADAGAVARLAARMRSREEAVVARLEAGFRTAAGDRDQLSALVRVVGELRYVRRFFEEIDAFEEALLDKDAEAGA